MVFQFWAQCCEEKKGRDANRATDTIAFPALQKETEKENVSPVTDLKNQQIIETTDTEPEVTELSVRVQPKVAVSPREHGGALALARSQQFGIVKAGHKGGMGRDKPGFTPVQHFTDMSGSDGAKAIEVPADVSEAWEKVLHGKTSFGWIYLEYDHSHKLVLKETAHGGLKALKEKIDRGTMGWGAFHCFAKEKMGAQECKRARYVLVQYYPEATPLGRRSLMLGHKRDVKAALRGTQADLLIHDPSELEEAEVIRKLQACAGAHMASAYEFEEGVSVAAAEEQAREATNEAELEAEVEAAPAGEPTAEAEAQ